ncbi:putative regulatory protein [Streptomyces himastatinicus ATCC 53653]|uniref:Putative regulatory protein n=2 Tax=Streptomyces violaceusniger group TaxID=2839105 RepID=D9W6S6_9ACTN|nr:putative regulatory protein [Streptomyces himastatinicus ATCC 53653]
MESPPNPKVRSGVSTMTEPSATGVPAYSETMRRERESASAARGLVSSSLRVWGLEDVEDSAWLVVTELVSNTVKHARLEMIRVKVSRVGPKRVRIAVTDRSRKLPTLCDAGEDDVNGRGLAIVAAMSQKWGVDPMRWGKRVWAELEVSP